MARRLHRLPRLLVVVLAAAAVGTLATTAAAQDTGLRDGADATGINFGAAVTVDALDDDAYTQLLVDNVNMVSTVSEFDMAVVQPERGVFDFRRADAVVDFAVEHGLTVRGHGLIGSGPLPDWVTNSSWTPDTLAEVLRTHVSTVVGRYAERNPGVIIEWDVVDSAFLPDGSPRPTIWQQVIGDDHLAIAFDAARAADPTALLYYDDFYDDLAIAQDAVTSGVPIVDGATAERSQCSEVPKCVAVQATISSLVARGVPVDGVGIQAHLLSPDPLDIGEFSAWIEDLGLRWAITEFDVPVPTTEVSNPDTLAFQADAYAGALQSCIDGAGCNTFITWGITDRLPPTADTTGGAFGGGLWFDVADTPKPAATAMGTVLAVALPAEPLTTDAPITTATVPPSTAATTSPTEDESSDPPTALIIGGIALAAAVLALVVVRARRR
jgi:endo-1,4-beta-xylanase